MKREIPGQRVYLVRLARGDGVKKPEKLEDFALALNAGGARYDSSMLSRMENGTRRVTLEDIDAIAPLDPLKRGKAWLACWDEELASTDYEDPRIGAVPLTEAQKQRALTAAAKKHAPPAAKSGNGGRRPKR